MDHEAIVERVVAWGSEEDNIRLAVLTGSVAPGDDQFDALSDLDIELYVNDPLLLLEQKEWFGLFGHVLVVEELENPDWHPTRLVHYVDGKIDFMIGQVEAVRVGVEYDQPYRILIDKDGLGERLRRANVEALPPSPSEFLRSVNCFYAAALMEAKCIVREEPWMASLRDRDLKDELLNMIGWDHGTRRGWDPETRQSDRHVRGWVDEDILVALDDCWADFSTGAMRRALRASVALFDTLETRTAGALGIEAFDGRAVQEEIERILGFTV
jgi:aminoglycoside 6-adenylyltransferase